MSISGQVIPQGAATPDPASQAAGPYGRHTSSDETQPAPPAPLTRTGRRPWGMILQLGVAVLLIGVAVSTSIQGLDDHNLRVHHLEHAALVCGGGLLGLLISRRHWPAGYSSGWEQRPWLRLAVLSILTAEPLALMILMIPFTSPWVDAHPPIHALEHLLLIVLGGQLGLLGYLIWPVLGWLIVFVTVAMMAAFAGMVLPT